jgi:hypothetical protein
MKYYGQAQGVAEQVIQRFKEGSVSQPLADIFIKNSPGSPSSFWSYRNRLIMHLIGQTYDARGFKQWLEAGRKVKKGTKAFHILAPVMAKVEVEDEQGAKVLISRLVGFKSVAVHPIHDTEVFDEELWAKSSTPEDGVRKFLDELPLREVAKAWGIELAAYSGREKAAKGWYDRGGVIGLGVKNLSTWTHELIHAAEDKLGVLPKGLRGMERQQAEVVAELGGAVLLIMMGYEVEADTGGAWKYIYSWADKDEDKAISMCLDVLGRVCEAINLVMETAAKEKVVEEAA